MYNFIKQLLEEYRMITELKYDQGAGPDRGHGNGLTSMGRWKRIRSGQRLNYLRVKGRRINQEKAASSRHVGLRAAINTRHGLYKKLNPTGKYSRRGLSFAQRSAVERVERRLAKLYVGLPAAHNSQWKARRKDSFRHSGASKAKVS